MKLTKKEIEILYGYGYPDEDIPQIEEAISKTKYYDCDNLGHEKRISIKKAKELLGIESFLSGIARSAFHFTSFREYNDTHGIFFDSYNLFDK